MKANCSLGIFVLVNHTKCDREFFKTTHWEKAAPELNSPLQDYLSQKMNLLKQQALDKCPNKPPWPYKWPSCLHLLSCSWARAHISFLGIHGSAKGKSSLMQAQKPAALQQLWTCATLPPACRRAVNNNTTAHFITRLFWKSALGFLDERKWWETNYISVSCSFFVPSCYCTAFPKCSEDDETVQPVFEQNGTVGKKHSWGLLKI